ncbi:acyl carrier protein [Streptomyces sp. RB110-1]|uniref:acyl carrier protein n=1 Tax=unclassified Streptomyces TaxID=2593676 RepID=UPI001901CBB8|nr:MULTISPECIES: acyl carrier protein [unclassified Streptomyces]MBK0373086.1 acyl carrier protein [Streptomyces sp. RB110-1]MBK0390546.1 acyl carrier protein [Streptomyces sp. RB110-2]
MPDTPLNPETPHARTVRTVLARELGLPADRIAPGDRLDELPEVDSVKLARAVARLEEILGVELDDDELFDTRTVGDLCCVVDRATRPA